MIAERYAKGETYKEIATALYIAPATVRNHLAAIYRKLSVTSKPELISALTQSGSGDVQAPTPLVTDKPSIAVLPFTNMSGDPEQGYFSDGITQDIVTALSHISELRVITRSSTMSDQADDLKSFGQELGVRYLLAGGVRKDGNRVRVTAQLIDAKTGHHLWADRYDRELEEVFAVQDDITHKITIEMRVHLSEGEKVRVLAGRTKKLEAWELLVRADELVNNLIRAENLEGRRLLERALRIDPCYAAAWAQLANTHVGDLFMGWTQSRERSLEHALDAARKALELDKEYPTALTILGYVHMFRGKHVQAVEVMDRAIALEPSNAEVVATAAYVLVFAGKLDAAHELIEQAMRLSPISPMWYLVCLGICHYVKNQQDLAIRTLRDAIDKVPGSAFPRPFLVSALVEDGRLEDAKQSAREIMRIERNFSTANWQRGGAPFEDASVSARLVENLRRACLPE
jgi:adenylate cyclase